MKSKVDNSAEEPTATETPQEETKQATTVKRLLALGYDIFILAALSMAYTAAATAIMHALFDVQAHDYQPMQKGPWFDLGLLATYILFYWYFWYRAGQTVGMRTWNIRVVSKDYSSLSHLQCLARIAAGTLTVLPFGIAYFWRFIDKDSRALHDRLSRTLVIQTPKTAKKRG